jgi:hypothetical protein
MQTLSEKEVSEQESLSIERLNKISTGYNFYNNRPPENLVDLMQWAKEQIYKYQCAQQVKPVLNNAFSRLEVFIHNKISIDGSFMKFVEEVGASVKSLHTDAITSWNSDYNDEHFVGTGVFEIVFNTLTFYQCSLFHKGNQNEDEVSFFVVVDKEQFNNYIKFRNSYVAWQKNRDRESQEIEVIGGDPIPYDPNLDWNDLFLPEDLKNNIIKSIDGFLNSKPIYDRLKVPWKMGIGIWGAQGNGKTTLLKILMARYPQLKPVTIQPGHPSPDELLEEAFDYAEQHAPAMLFFEDLQELIKTIDTRHFLQLLDGVQKRDGILTIVTGNDFSTLEENLKNRPRRFDKFFEFPLPNLDQTTKYLSKYFSEILSSEKIISLAKKAVKNHFTYAHLQELYFNCVFIALADNRQEPKLSDINESINQVIHGKKFVEEDFVKSKRDLADEDEDSDM